MKSKILKNLIFLIIGIVGVFSTTTVHAETYSGGFGDGNVIETKVYVNKNHPNYRPNFHQHQTMHVNPSNYDE